jgi:hypothetical protein
VLRSDEEDDEDDEESLRRGVLSWLEDEALLLMAWVLLSTSDPKESLGVVSLVLCDRAGFCCALETCALAATSDVTPTTGDPLKTSSDQEVSKERANPTTPAILYWPRHFCRPGKNCPKLGAGAIASPECRLY